jgi:hypothetical protein
MKRGPLQLMTGMATNWKSRLQIPYERFYPYGRQASDLLIQIHRSRYIKNKDDQLFPLVVESKLEGSYRILFQDIIHGLEIAGSVEPGRISVL